MALATPIVQGCRLRRGLRTFRRRSRESAVELPICFIIDPRPQVSARITRKTLQSKALRERRFIEGASQRSGRLTDAPCSEPIQSQRERTRIRTDPGGHWETSFPLLFAVNSKLSPSPSACRNLRGYQKVVPPYLRGGVCNSSRNRQSFTDLEGESKRSFFFRERL